MQMSFHFSQGFALNFLLVFPDWGVKSKKLTKNVQKVGAGIQYLQGFSGSHILAK